MQACDIASLVSKSVETPQPMADTSQVRQNISREPSLLCLTMALKPSGIASTEMFVFPLTKAQPSSSER